MEESIHQAAYEGNIKRVRALLEQGISVHARDLFQNATPLHYATARNRLDVVNLLLENGAQIDLADGNDCTPLLLAKYQNNNAICQVFESVSGAASPSTPKSSPVLKVAVPSEFKAPVKKERKLTDTVASPSVSNKFSTMDKTNTSTPKDNNNKGQGQQSFLTAMSPKKSFAMKALQEAAAAAASMSSSSVSLPVPTVTLSSPSAPSSLPSSTPSASTLHPAFTSSSAPPAPLSAPSSSSSASLAANGATQVPPASPKPLSSTPQSSSSPSQTVHRVDKRKLSNIGSLLNDDSTPAKPPVACICRQNNSDEYTIICDTCDRSVHGRCVGINETDGAKLQTYKCPDCTQRAEVEAVMPKKKWKRLLEHE
eukprot:GILK01007253.1.p1 GENE.GILK01007253.1~~GILK01007253.1.p1  ORF type:complete len:378 (+),score=71.72 GILK01007253.1:33-1136(+)